MTRTELSWLGSCAAVASGIAVALVFPRAAELWPEIVGIIVLIAALGYGFAVRGWRFVMLAFVGLAIGYQSLVEAERNYRLTPWMRYSEHKLKVKENPTRLKRNFSERMSIGVEQMPECVAINRAILLGERQQLPPELKRVFIDSGAIHIFAISGLHVMVMAKVLMCMVAMCFVPLRLQGIVAVPILWGYILMIGAPPSAIRAGIMCSFYLAAPIWWRRPNGIISWAIAFLAVHVVSPEQLKNVSSLFSFVVMLSLVLANRYVKTQSGSFRQLVFLSFIAWSAGVPIAAMIFKRLTLGGLLANLALTSIAAYSVVVGVIAVMSSFVSETLAIHFNNLSALVTKAMVVVVTAVSKIPFVNLELPGWRVLDCVGWYVSLVLFVFLVHHIQERHRQL